MIPQQSNSPVRVCKSCYKEFYNHLNKVKKQSTCSTYEQTFPVNRSINLEQQQLVSDEAEIKEVVKNCIDDTIKDSRVEEWVNSATEQVEQHLKTEKDSDVSVSEAIEAIKLNDDSSEEYKQIVDDQNEKLNGNNQNDQNNSYNNQTSDSEDENNELSNSVEDILDETHRKVILKK